MIIKRILSLVCSTMLILVVNAQQKMKMYEKEWKQVDSFIKKAGLISFAKPDPFRKKY